METSKIVTKQDVFDALVVAYRQATEALIAEHAAAPTEELLRLNDKKMDAWRKAYAEAS